MILYRPTDGDVLDTPLTLRPRTCFLMTQLGESVPPDIQKIRKRVIDQLRKNRIAAIDADSIVTGKDFLDKIWRIIITVPMGVAIIHEDMPPKTIANVFYELGMMDALGKRTVVIKSVDASIPSDFARTEYISDGKAFDKKINSFISSSLQQESYFETMAEDLENNPLLSIDYLRRAYLISGNERHKIKVKNLLDGAQLERRAKNSVEMLWAKF